MGESKSLRSLKITQPSADRKVLLFAEGEASDATILPQRSHKGVIPAVPHLVLCWVALSIACPETYHGFTVQCPTWLFLRWCPAGCPYCEQITKEVPCYVIPDVYTSDLGHVLIVGIIALPSPAISLSAGAMNMPVLYLSLLQQPPLHPPTPDY